MVSHRDNNPAPFPQDSYLTPFLGILEQRRNRVAAVKKRLLTRPGMTLCDFASAHEYYGLHKLKNAWVFRELAPNATSITLIGDFSDWRQLEQYRLTRLNEHGDWEVFLPLSALKHGDHYKLVVEWPGGSGERIPAYARFVTQNEQTKIFTAEVFDPDQPYVFKHPAPSAPDAPLIYESHVGMAQEEPKVGSFDEYRIKILPRIVKAGYNTVQLMAVMNHPYYGSFGYHVGSFFSIAGRFGTPDQFKELIDEAHRLGLRVIIDMVHSHAVKNEVEGLGKFDGTRYLYFHDGARGEHAAWDSLCFNYDKSEVLNFLLSSCRFYLEEYKLDGFRFDGVTSMMYYHHGLGKAFTSYSDYFSADVDEEALTYLALANSIIHDVRPDATTIAEDVSGMPGLAAPVANGGLGFDYRLAMGVTDMWFKLFDIPDQDWNMFYLYGELSNRRCDEKTVSYLECHDQAIVGGQTAIFRLIGTDMYTHMSRLFPSLTVDRGMALHKMARLATAATAGQGYLNFMGNEYGHPEWIDFPREGNGWSMYYARRQWSLTEDANLLYGELGQFDEAMLKELNKASVYKHALQTVAILDSDKIIAFERGNLWFFLNFHPEKSYQDYEIEVLPGEYECVLSSDEIRFGGFNRVDTNINHFALDRHEHGELRSKLSLYLPSRTVLVLRRKGGDK